MEENLNKRHHYVVSNGQSPDWKLTAHDVPQGLV